MRALSILFFILISNSGHTSPLSCDKTNVYVLKCKTEIGNVSICRGYNQGLLLDVNGSTTDVLTTKNDGGRIIFSNEMASENRIELRNSGKLQKLLLRIGGKTTVGHCQLIED